MQNLWPVSSPLPADAVAPLAAGCSGVQSLEQNGDAATAREEHEFDLWLPHLCEVQVVDGRQLMDDCADLFVDNIHPNDRGFAMYADRLAAVMRPHLPPLGRR